MTTTINFGGNIIRNNEGTSDLEGTNPSVWAVAGETIDRVGSGTINTSANTGNVFESSRDGKSIWIIGGSNSSIDVNRTINHVTKDWTVAVAVGNLTFISGATPQFFMQIVSESDGANSTNHAVTYTPSSLTFTVDENPPAAGTSTVVVKGEDPSDSVIVFVHSSASSGDFTVYVNGISMGTVAHTEAYNGSAPTLMRVGNQANNNQEDSTGMQVYAFAVWNSALSVADVRKITLNSMTCPYSPISTESIVTNGLVMHLDASNTSSYPGSGTTWTDLTGNGNNVTMVNSGDISFNAGNGGYFSTGTNGYFSGAGTSTIPQGNHHYTIVIWGRRPSNWPNVRTMVGIGTQGAAHQFNALETGSSLGYLTNYWWSNDLFASGNPSGISLNTWFMCTGRYNGVTRSVWGNTTQHGSDTPGTPINLTSTNIYVANVPVLNRPWNADIAVVYYYNRDLSDEEIAHNFNALKGRFGL